MKAAGVPVAFMNPSQGRLSWLCGYVLGANTKNYYHAHDYVESFINHKACAQMNQPIRLRNVECVGQAI